MTMLCELCVKKVYIVVIHAAGFFCYTDNCFRAEADLTGSHLCSGPGGSWTSEAPGLG